MFLTTSLIKAYGILLQTSQQNLCHKFEVEQRKTNLFFHYSLEKQILLLPFCWLLWLTVWRSVSARPANFLHHLLLHTLTKKFLHFRCDYVISQTAVTQAVVLGTDLIIPVSRLPLMVIPAIPLLWGQQDITFVWPFYDPD